MTCTLTRQSSAGYTHREP